MDLDVVRTLSAKTVVDPRTGCWEWTGRRDKDGYGTTGLQRRHHTSRAHRNAWIGFYGPIPDGLQILHHCDNPPCWNPAHLFIGTNDDNVADKMNKGRQARPPEKTHCPQGHEYTPDNIYVIPSTGAKACRACRYKNVDRVHPGNRDRCANGHEYTPENTYIRPGNGYRGCWACINAMNARAKERRRVRAQ